MIRFQQFCYFFYVNLCKFARSAEIQGRNARCGGNKPSRALTALSSTHWLDAWNWRVPSCLSVCHQYNVGLHIYITYYFNIFNKYV